MEKLVTNPSLEVRIAAARSEIIKDDKYPRAVRASDLNKCGLVTYDDQAAFCQDLINDPHNEYGRVLIISRNPDEKSSPVRWFSRGAAHPLGESFIPPHQEPAESLIETFELISGEAIFVIHAQDDPNSECQFIKLQPHEPVYVMPGQIHSVLCCSKTVEVVEFKLVSPRKKCPQFARDLNLVDENCNEKKGPQISEYLTTMHQKAELYFASSQS
jgi:hypothetical protein